jgi:hypothetical protein
MCTEFLQVKWLKENMNNSECVSVVSDSELLVIFVTLDGEDTAINISDYYKNNVKTEDWKRK